MCKVVVEFSLKGKATLIKPLKTDYGVVEAGFVTDGFAIPWYLRWFHSPFGKGLSAAIWHDHALKANRDSAHKEFLGLLKAGGVPVWKAYIMFYVASIYHFLPRKFKMLI